MDGFVTHPEVRAALAQMMAPIGQEIDRQGGTHVTMSCIVDLGVLHIDSNASDARKAEVLQKVGTALLAEAKRLAASPNPHLIIPGRAG